MAAERNLEQRLVRLCQQHGVLAYKFVSPGRAGVPDRMLVFPNGTVAFVEVKAEKGVLSALQDNEIRRLRKQKQQVFVLRPSNWETEFEPWFGAMVSLP